MKKSVKVEVQEVDNEGLISLLDKRVMVYCGVYIYLGTLEGVNTDDIKLTNASIVYNTGALKNPTPDTAEAVPNDLYVRTAAIECYYEAP